jgi:hypothetical protein
MLEVTAACTSAKNTSAPSLKRRTSDMIIIRITIEDQNTGPFTCRPRDFFVSLLAILLI